MDDTINVGPSTTLERDFVHMKIISFYFT